MIGIGRTIDSFEIHRPNIVVREFQTLDSLLGFCRFIEADSMQIDKGTLGWTLQYTRIAGNE